MPKPRISNEVVVLANITPIVGVATTTSAYVNMKDAREILAIVQGEVTGTVDGKLVQATSAAGAGKKDITGKAITQLAADGQAAIELRQDEKGTALLDVDNAFVFVAVEVEGTNAADVVSAVILTSMETTMDNVPTGSVLDEIIRGTIS